MVNVSELRKRYTKGGLADEELPEEPMPLFKKWLEEAVNAEVPEPNAMALATVSTAGSPNVRMVLLKGVEDGAIAFYTNYNSRKAKDLDANPSASCTFWWAELERQVRISGTVKKLPETVSENYFATRPRDSQIGAWASDQSMPVVNREELEKKFTVVEERFRGKDIPKPDDWGGFEIRIQEIEFWQGRPGRMHDRIHYLFSSGKWNRQRLSP
jgi:pyridoxamine 5'-phosphate oxidase